MKELARFLISPAASVLDALTCIDQNAKGIALVVDEESRLAGTVTDGDVRRALLGGATLNSPLESYIQRRFVTVSPDVGRAEVLDMMQARRLRHMPVVDRIGKLVGLHSLQELLGNQDRPNWAVIMAGGKGERLRPITELLPKPMIKVAGRPILERLLLHLVSFGFTRIFISVNYLSSIIENYFGDGAKFGCKIEYLRETEPLGTGGALSLLPEKPRHPLLVLNGDLVTQVNLARFLECHVKGGFAASVGLRRYTHQVPYGCLEVLEQRVHGLEEKPIIEKLINAGVYFVSPEIISRVPSRFCPMTDLISESLSRNEPVGAFHIDEDWIDVGQHEQLKQAQQGKI